jgi:hypothetical protein
MSLLPPPSIQTQKCLRRASRGGSRGGSRRARAGFTLLELVLAAVLGTLVMGGVLAILFSLERTGTSLQRRGDEAAGLQRTRLVMERAFGSILTAPVQFTRTAAGTTSEEETAPARVLLEPDPNLDVLLERPELAGGATVTPAQRLEIVLIDPPVPASARDPFDLARAIEQRTKQDREAARQAEEDSGSTTIPAALVRPPSTDDAVRAVRGAFELRPQPRSARAAPDAPQAYELWWMPIHLEDSATDATLEDQGDEQLTTDVAKASRERPYLIAGNLTYIRWRMFDDREKKTEFRAVAANKLPAYIEMQVRTRGGLEAEWLFEVGWAVGPETSSQLASTNAGGTGAATTNTTNTTTTTGPGGTTTTTTSPAPVGTPIAQPVPFPSTNPSTRPIRPGSVIPSATPRRPGQTSGTPSRSVPERVRRRTLDGSGVGGGGR